MAPYLSVVAVSRNDDHGGDPLVRTQLFIDCLAEQCARFGLPAELIIVEWNPPEGRAPLGLALTAPTLSREFATRVIRVPRDIHLRFKHGPHLPLFQMIGKNVGIRRARGEFVLATNIDVLFSDELVAFIASQKLQTNAHYRVDRFDIKPGLSVGTPTQQALSYAWNHVIRVNRRLHPPLLVRSLYGTGAIKREVIPDASLLARYRQMTGIQMGTLWALSPSRNVPIHGLHTNACGDFALMSREGWAHIGGYPEFESFSMNIDSVGLASSHYAGFCEIALLPPAACFHIEHSVGSGYTEQGQGTLFGRIRALGIPSPAWHVIESLADSMRVAKAHIPFNSSNWGLCGVELAEAPIAVDPPRHSPPHASQSHGGAIRPEYDYEVLAVQCQTAAHFT